LRKKLTLKRGLWQKKTVTIKTLWVEVDAASPVLRNLENEHEIISMAKLNQYKRTDYQTHVTMVTISK
jgi:2'-5' RNA ligase